jgi:hypothetical protein
VSQESTSRCKPPKQIFSNRELSSLALHIRPTAGIDFGKMAGSTFLVYSTTLGISAGFARSN